MSAFLYTTPVKDWFRARYFAEGNNPVAGSPIPEYHDSVPQPGYEAILATESGLAVTGPGWTERILEIPSNP